MSETKFKIAFLDRDGVINRKAAPHCYISSTGEFVFNLGIFEVLNFLKEKGFQFIVLTNQRGVARGIFAENDLAKIHQNMVAGLLAQGIKILDIFYCPHEEGECNCRKPKPGLVQQALAKHRIDLPYSIFIGDSESDGELSRQVGLRFFLVRPNFPEDFLTQYHDQKN